MKPTRDPSVDGPSSADTAAWCGHRDRLRANGEPIVHSFGLDVPSAQKSELIGLDIDVCRLSCSFISETSPFRFCQFNFSLAWNSQFEVKLQKPTPIIRQKRMLRCICEYISGTLPTHWVKYNLGTSMWKLNECHGERFDTRLNMFFLAAYLKLQSFYVHCFHPSFI